MTDWSSDLSAALSSGDPAFMKAMLARVPKDVLNRAIPYLAEMARLNTQEGKLEAALACYDQLIEADTNHVEWHIQRTRVSEQLEQRRQPPPPGEVTFDPALFDDPTIPKSFEEFRVQGLRQLLWRYSGYQSSRNILTRLEDPVWLAAWDTALSALQGARVLFRGSELGVFALRALHHGAAHALAVETFPLDVRIARGLVQKHFLAAWHALHGGEARKWSDAERTQSFESFMQNIDVVAADGSESSEAHHEVCVFPNIDHSLLSTGIIKAVRQHRARATAAAARVLPAKAQVFAMGIQFDYSAAAFQLQPMNQLRWSFYPQALELTADCWTALTAPMPLGEIDFTNFTETLWDVRLPVVADGTVDAIVYWFELDLGTARISNAPGSDLRCIKPAVHYTDPLVVQSGRSLPLRVHVHETRLHFQTQPAASQRRSGTLPGWYIPMLLDRSRNESYRAALGKALASAPSRVVLDIGAGCGLLSMMAVEQGAERVVGCELNAAICKVGGDIIKLNRFSDRITLINKDCRQMKIPEDLPQRADLALFEMFDCSLIGEGVLHFLAHVREHLLAENARYLPAGARIRAQIIEYRLDTIWNIDVNLLNPFRYSPSFINVDATKLAHRALTEPFDLFAFDFSKAGPTPEVRELQVPALTGGTAGAVLFWFDLQLDDTCWLSNAPSAEHSLHWKQGLQFLPEVHVNAGMQLPLMANHNGSSLTFRWKPDALPKAALSTLPRFDPHWLSATHELEQQTRGLLHHCNQNPDEYAKVAAIAQRFAIDPAAHGLDPVTAQRFATMLSF